MLTITKERFQELIIEALREAKEELTTSMEKPDQLLFNSSGYIVHDPWK